MKMFWLPLYLTQLLAKCTPQCLWRSTKHILWKLGCYNMLPDFFGPWDTDRLQNFNLPFDATDNAGLEETRIWILFMLFSKLWNRKRLWKPRAASSSIERKFPIMKTTRWRSMTGVQLLMLWNFHNEEDVAMPFPMFVGAVLGEILCNYRKKHSDRRNFLLPHIWWPFFGIGKDCPAHAVTITSRVPKN